MGQEQKQLLRCPKCKKEILFKIAGVAVGCEIESSFCTKCLEGEQGMVLHRLTQDGWEQYIKVE